jgi:sugar (pentulose or hexulose) kinase
MRHREERLDRSVVVLDVGKTLVKLTLWDEGTGTLIRRHTLANRSVETKRHRALDPAHIEAWLETILTEFATLGPVAAIIPVSHGAAAAAIRGDALAHPPIDYEGRVSPETRAAYDVQRDPFWVTGSPALPNGLNLGVQLHQLEEWRALQDGDRLVPWPQYWAWRLSGESASEISSLGCHTDLWAPAMAAASPMSRRRGWSERFAPLRKAGEPVGVLTNGWAARTGIGSRVRVFCGVHDSNAALHGMRGFSEIGGGEATVLSTGTWFVAMRSTSDQVQISSLPEDRDCLVNIDVEGRLVPSSRFMGGKEIERLCGGDSELFFAPQYFASAVSQAVAAGVMVLPAFVPGVGPFPRGHGRWIGTPDTDAVRIGAIALYAALVADTSLDLIGARDRIVLEGRFAHQPAFASALAALRPNDRIFVSHAEHGVAFGALRLAYPHLTAASELREVEPAATDLGDYRERWRRLVAENTP